MNIDTVRYFAKHMVCLGWVDQTPGDRASANGGLGEFHNVSGFVISVQNTWFLFTAGHILRDIECARAKGQKLVGWHLDDAASLDARYTSHEGLVNFDFDGAAKFWYFPEDETGADYAFVHLRPLYRMLLETNGITALTEKAWKVGVPDECDSYWMLGVPNEFMQQSEERIEKGFAFLHIERLQPPLPELDIPFAHGLFYGRIDISPEVGKSHRPLNDIRGMSGGPIFGFKRMENGEGRYWIIASQSAWFRQKRIIVGCPVWVLAEWIGRIELPQE